MKLTTMDICSKEFTKCFRGYDPDEVDEFLEQISEDYEKIYKENSTINEKIIILKEKLDHYVKVEDTIQNTLILAQNAAEQAKRSSQKEGEIIIQNANKTAQNILDKAERDVRLINEEYEKIKEEYIKFRMKFKNFMNAQVDMFNSLEKDFVRNYNVETISGVEAMSEIPEIKEKEIVSNCHQTQESSIKLEENEIEDNEESNISQEELNAIKSFIAE